jgi:hypothetical protein
MVGKIPDLVTGKLPPGAVACGTMIRERGAPTIFMGRTPHEGHDEMCRGFLAAA